MNENIRPEDMKKVYSLENMDFLIQHGVKSKLLRVLKENFDVQEMMVIKQKHEEPKMPNVPGQKDG